MGYMQFRSDKEETLLLGRIPNFSSNCSISPNFRTSMNDDILGVLLIH